MASASIHPNITQHPVIYEINTWVWLGELSRASGRRTDLGSVPGAAWDAIAALGFDAVWLMGVWERSPAGLAVARANPGLAESWQRVLGDIGPDDVAGSPYCVRRYVVDGHLGGPAGLAAARRELAQRDMALVLDFVPNHVAPDHPWVAEHPERLVTGTQADLDADPSSFLQVGGTIAALGRDPYFPAWPDVVQLNAFGPGLRAAATGTVEEIAAQCDGVRCDMAMLMLNDVFARTWGERAGPPPATEYWSEVIAAVRAQHPAFRFLAEAYWDREWDLQQLGFDGCYDKRLYDRLAGGSAGAVRGHLGAGLDYQRRLVRFLENHDEPRAAATFPPRRHRAAAVTTFTLPGARLVHEGQIEGRKVQLPVFLARRPDEPVDEELQAFYQRLLAALRDPVLRTGAWERLDVGGWAGDDSCAQLLSWCWDGDPRWLVAVNLGEETARGHLALPWADVAGRDWQLDDPTTGVSLRRAGGDLASSLYIELGPWGWHLFRVTPAANETPEAA
jgi:Alpha amylase, catalytic domain